MYSANKYNFISSSLVSVPITSFTFFIKLASTSSPILTQPVKVDSFDLFKILGKNAFSIGCANSVFPY